MESLADELRNNGWKAEANPDAATQFDQVKVLADEVFESYAKDTSSHSTIYLIK